jgi:RND family efflux transporter MFP subunit
MPERPPRPAAPFRRAALSATLALLAAAVTAAWLPVAGTAHAEPLPPPPVVSVAAVVQRAIEPTAPQVGRVEAAQRVELRARVAGPVEAVLFREGEIVRAGQPLFRIDPRPFEAAVDRARAELQLAEARERLARGEAERARLLLGEQALALEEAERRGSAHAEARARVAAAQAALQAASLEREFTTVVAPITGRIGRAQVTAGNFVAAGGQPLATLTGVAPLHVWFDVADAGLVAELASQRQAAGRHAKIIDPRSAALLATAPIDFIDHEVAAQAATLRVRARIAQPPPQLLPGQFVRVQLAGAARDALLVPEQAVGTDQGQRYVLVVQGGQLAYRKVRLGALHGDQRVIADGLQAGEQVVVSGLMKLRPGMKVLVRPAGADAAVQASPVRAARS